MNVISVNAYGDIFKCRIVFDKYVFNNRVSILLYDVEEGGLFATATINLISEDLGEDEVALNHDCAAYVEKALVDGGIIYPSHRTVKPKGSFVTFRICKLKKQMP